MNTNLTITAASLNQTPLAWKNNRQNILNAIKKARQEQTDLLVLPELSITGYGCEDLFLSEWLPEKAMEELLLIREYCQDITVVIGLPVRFKGYTYNCACLIENQTIRGFTAKQFLANDGVHYEPRWFTPWTTKEVENIQISDNNYPFGEIIYNWQELNIAVEICEDAWPRKNKIRPAQRYYEQNTHIILNPSASHSAFGKGAFRENLFNGSSESYNCLYVYANLCGNEAGRMIYDGDGLICYKGDLIQRNKRFSFQDVTLISAVYNPAKNYCEAKAPLNTEHFSNEDQFTRATALGLFDYLRKSKSKGFVISLSGGADSSTCAVLVHEMIKQGLNDLGKEDFLKQFPFIDRNKIPGKAGNENLARSICYQVLTCAYQATQNSSEETFNSAKKLAEGIGANFKHWYVDSEIKHYRQTIEDALGRALSWEQDDLALQNIQARARAPVIWMLANTCNALLITTSNRSEGDVGYTTMDGDTAGGIAPIAGIDKPFIRQWLWSAQQTRGYECLQYVNNLQPTAELRPSESDQSDESDLMPYDLMVLIEREAIAFHNAPLETYEKLKKEVNFSPETLKKHIATFFRLWARNQWKRERIAPSFHLDDFNVDPKTWCRFPILNGNFEEEIEAMEKTGS